jgi:NAD(P) transhydrogenase subunit beta
MAVAGALIGAVSFSGSVVAFGKLQELKFFKDDAKFRFTGQQKGQRGDLRWRGMLGWSSP